MRIHQQNAGTPAGRHALRRQGLKTVYLLIILVPALVAGALLLSRAGGRGKPGYHCMDGTSVVRHACGGLPDEAYYTNSREALESSLEKGSRFIEIDFDIDLSGELVVSHDEERWRTLTGSGYEIPYTKESIAAGEILGQYHALTFDEICEYLENNKNLYLITDTKYTDPDSIALQFREIVETAAGYKGVLKRIIPQIYNEKMLDVVLQAYDFETIIYTLYLDHWTGESVLDFCGRTRVGCVAVGHNWFSEGKIDWETVENWMKHGIKVAVFTVNDPDEAKMFRDKGISLIYSDDITQEDIDHD